MIGARCSSRKSAVRTVASLFVTPRLRGCGSLCEAFAFKATGRYRSRADGGRRDTRRYASRVVSCSRRQRSSGSCLRPPQQTQKSKSWPRAGSCDHPPARLVAPRPVRPGMCCGLSAVERTDRRPWVLCRGPAWSIYGAKRAQPVATGRKCDRPENGSIRPIGNRWQPTATVSERMARRGSTVRVRQRAFEVPGNGDFCFQNG